MAKSHAGEQNMFPKKYRCGQCSQIGQQLSVNASVSFFLDLATSKDADITFSGQSYDDYLRSYQEEANARNACTTVWAAPYYDSIWALALALNASLENLQIMNFSLTKYRHDNPNITDIIAQHVYELDFEGISGRIKFNRETGFSNRTLLLTQFIDGMTKQAGFYSSGNFVLYSNSQDFVSGEFEMRYDYVAVPVGVMFVILTI